MESVTSLNLNLQYPNYTTTMHAVQNDRLARKIAATLSDGATAWTPPSGTLAVVRFAKPDGTMGFYDTDEDDNPAVTWTGNVATIMLAEQVLTVAGDVFCQINFYTASEERLSTFSFVIRVQPNVITDETIESTDYFNILTQQIAEILDALSEMPTPSTTTPKMDGTASVGTEAKYARGDHRHPTDTSRASTAVATTSANGLMSSTDKTKLDGIASGAQVNSITGVKGNAESSYRTGNVNITPANVGAVPTTRTVNSKALSNNVTLNASDIPNNSDVSGTNVDDALETLSVNIVDINKLSATEVINFDTERRFLVYFNMSSSTGSKPGFTSNGYLITIVRGTSSTVSQFAYPNADDQNMWVRKMVSSSWTSWQPMNPLLSGASLLADYSEITWNTDYVVSDTDSDVGGSIYSCGKLAIANVSARLKADITDTGSITIAYLPSKCKPATTSRGIAVTGAISANPNGNGQNDTVVRYCGVSVASSYPNGRIYINSADGFTSNVNYFISILYFLE